MSREYCYLQRQDGTRRAAEYILARDWRPGPVQHLVKLGDGRRIYHDTVIRGEEISARAKVEFLEEWAQSGELNERNDMKRLGVEVAAELANARKT